MGGRGATSGFSLKNERMPSKKTFDNGSEGYEISWSKLEQKLNQEYPKEIYKNGSRYWYVNNWQKNGYDRSYISLREYRNGSLKRGEVNLGYYDNKTNRYIVTDNYKTVHDVISGDVNTPPKKKKWRR